MAKVRIEYYIYESERDIDLFSYSKDIHCWGDLLPNLPSYYGGRS